MWLGASGAVGEEWFAVTAAVNGRLWGVMQVAIVESPGLDERHVMSLEGIFPCCWPVTSALSTASAGGTFV